MQCQLSPHEEKVVQNVEYWTACIFHGAGNLQKTRHETREGACAAAEAMVTPIKGSMVYAVWRNHQALTDTFKPVNRRATMANFQAFLINFDGKEPTISSFPDSMGLDKALERKQPGIPLRSAEDIKTSLSMAQMVQIINRRLPDGTKPIKVLKDKEVGSRRAWSLLTTHKDIPDTEPLAQDAPAPVETGQRSAADLNPSGSQYGVSEVPTTQNEENDTMATTQTASDGKKKRAAKTNGAAEKPKREKKVRELGEAKPVRAGSSLDKILRYALKGKHTVAQIANYAGIEDGTVISAVSKTQHRLTFVLPKSHGVKVEIDDSGVVSATLPKGFTEETFFKAPKE